MVRDLLKFLELRYREHSIISPHGTAMPKGIYFTAVFFHFFSTPNLWGHWTDLNQTGAHIQLMTAVWKICPNSPGIYPPPRPHGLGAKNAFLGPTLIELWPNISLQLNMISTIGKKIVNLQGIPTTFDKLWSKNGWGRLVSFCPPPKFSHLETLPALPHVRYITDSRQTLARVM